MSTPNFDDRDGFIWMNGSLMPWRDAKVHVLTHALHYASCVFEGVRSYSGKIFKLQEHTDRLFFSAKTLDMTIPFSADAVNQAQADVLKANNITDGYLRPMVWRGSEQMGARTPKGRRSTGATA